MTPRPLSRLAAPSGRPVPARLAVRAFVTLAALGCESRYAYPPLDSGSSDTGADVAVDPPDLETPDVGPECPATACTSEGNECSGAAVRSCAVIDGCLTETLIPCGDDTTCVVTLENGPGCVPTTDPCAGLPPCTTVGATCDAEAQSVVCEALPNGCLLETRTDCAALGLVCSQGVCAADPCDGKVRCAQEKEFCDGDKLQRCAVDTDGCLVLSTDVNCADTPGAECIEGNPPRCSGQIIGGYRLTVVLDTFADSPLGSPLTALDRAPAIAGHTVAFRASTAAPLTPASATLATGVLAWDSDTRVLATVAQAGDPLPSLPGATFETFDALGTNGPRVALPVPGSGAVAPRIVFVGNATGQRRALVEQAGTGLQLLVTRDTPIPNSGATFVGMSEPTPAADLTFFNGNDFGSVSGVYRRDAAGTLLAIATNATAMPNGVTTLTGISLGEAGNDTLFLVGFGKAPFGASFGEVQRSIYRTSLAGGPLSTVVDRNTPVPGESEDEFSAFSGPVVTSNDLFFVGLGRAGAQKPLGPETYKALYRVPLAGGELEPVVDTNSPMPGGTETFATDASDGLSGVHVCTDGNVVVFRGVGTASQVVTRTGIYAVQAGGDAVRVLDTSLSLDGHTLTDLRVGRRCASEGRIVIHATFGGGGEAILLASPVTAAPSE